MALFKNVNGVNVQMTPQEEADFEASRTPSLSQAKATAITKIRTERTSRERVGATSGGRTIKVDPETLLRLQALQDASTPGQQVPVELVDGSIVKVPAAALNGLIVAVQARMLALADAESTKYDEVQALADVAAVRAYDLTAGWPA